MRGLPGSGKSTKAAEIALKRDAVVCSTDDYFVRPGGAYAWYAAELSAAHAWNLKRAQRWLSEGDSVIVDNCNVKRAHFQPYLDLAPLFDGVEIVVVGALDAASVKLYAARNQHSVPEATILRMALQWEP